MTLDELRESWAKNCEIDVNDMTTAAAKSPNLHALYLDELIQYKLKLLKIQTDMVQYRAKRVRYYRGEMTREELLAENWGQWQYKTLKSEIDGLIEAEPEYIKFVTREVYTKTVVFFLDSVMQEIKSRSFHCRNLIDWAKHRAGN